MSRYSEQFFEVLDGALDDIHSASTTLSRPDGTSVTFQPFFTSLNGLERHSLDIEAADGGIFARHTQDGPHFSGRVELRMGDYDSGSVGSSTFSLPKGLEKEPSLGEIKQEANGAFWQAADGLEEAFAKTMGRPSGDGKERYQQFARTSAVVYRQPDVDLTFDQGEIEDLLRKVTADLQHDRIHSVSAGFSLSHATRYFVSSEGGRILTSSHAFRIHLEVSTVDEKNLIVPHGWSMTSPDISNLPDYGSLMEIGERITGEVLEIAVAPFGKNGAYATMLCPQNVGVLWHEVIGHSLEGHRMKEDRWGDRVQVFAGQEGNRIAPDFLSLYDRPSDTSLVGHYAYDDEGVPAQDICLVKDGVLQTYLHSRGSAGYFGTQSNGHARSNGFRDPTPRMSNLFVESSAGVPLAELEEQLVKRVVDTGADNGLMLIGARGGQTLPDESFYSTSPAQIFRVDKKGKKTRLRGVYVVGTPHATLQAMIGTSTETGAFTGFCGAESGWVPSTQVAPWALVKTLEVNRIPKGCYDKIRTPIIT